MKFRLPSDYPVIIKQISSHLVVSAPDWGIYISEPAANLTSEKIGSLVVNVMKRIDRKLHELDANDYPEPSSLKEALPSQGGYVLGTNAAARVAGLSPSSVRRAANAGQLRSRKTSGGHRRFSEDDIRMWALSFSASKKDDTKTAQPIGIVNHDMDHDN